MPYPDRSEEDNLVKRSQEGDMKSFERLVLIHQDRVYNLALRLVRNPEDALDVAQEVFCSAFRKIASFKGRASFSTWLHQITLNNVRNLWRKQGHNPSNHAVSLDQPSHPQDPQSEFPQLPASGPNPSQQAAGHEMMGILGEQLNKLPLEYREILLLRFQQDLSYEEIAEALQCEIGTVKSRISRARNELRKRMEPFL